MGKPILTHLPRYNKTPIGQDQPIGAFTIRDFNYHIAELSN
jgi:hypothetical protein